MELAYPCRLRGTEVVNLTHANELEEGILTNRRKGSRDNIVRWTPRLRGIWDSAKASIAHLGEAQQAHLRSARTMSNYRGEPWRNIVQIKFGYSVAAVHHTGN